MLWSDRFILFFSFMPPTSRLGFSSLAPSTWSQIALLFLSSHQILLSHSLLKCKISATRLSEDFVYNVKQAKSITHVCASIHPSTPHVSILRVAVFSQILYQGLRAFKKISLLVFLNPYGKGECSGLVVKTANIFLGLLCTRHTGLDLHFCYLIPTMLHCDFHKEEAWFIPHRVPRVWSSTWYLQTLKNSLLAAGIHEWMIWWLHKKYVIVESMSANATVMLFKQERDRALSSWAGHGGHYIRSSLGKGGSIETSPCAKPKKQ